jgi:hypothetical protein
MCYIVRDPNADITLRSSDGMLFKFFRKNLEVHSGVFADAGAFEASSKEIVDLSETSEILELFLQLMSHQEPPNLMSLEFNILASLAEAVEKYQVFSAMAICDVCMRCVFRLFRQKISAKDRMGLQNSPPSSSA